MNNLIYFPLQNLVGYDSFLKSPDYAYSNWFNLCDTLEWPVHTISRVHRLNTPWDLSSTVCPIPAINHSEQDFSKVIESIADEIYKKINSSNRTPYLLWSGGIDSTSILVSLLKVADQDFLNKLIILHNELSIIENPYFYNRHIQNKLNTQDLDSFEVTKENFNQIIILDGEAGNQCMGWRSINAMAYYREFDLLDAPLTSINDLTKLLPGSSQFAVDLIQESIKYAPIDIKTGYDFIWWANFNFKFDDVLLRKILAYTKNLNSVECADFWNNSLCRFYAHPQMQVWSMISKDYRREKTRIVSKFFSKKYIYDFDHNKLWYANKREEGSDGVFFINSRIAHNTPIIAIDKSWTKYNIKDWPTRQALGNILQRI